MVDVAGERAVDYRSQGACEWPRAGMQRGRGGRCPPAVCAAAVQACAPCPHSPGAAAVGAGRVPLVAPPLPLAAGQVSGRRSVGAGRPAARLLALLLKCAGGDGTGRTKRWGGGRRQSVGSVPSRPGIGGGEMGYSGSVTAGWWWLWVGWRHVACARPAAAARRLIRRSKPRQPSPFV